jgi:hypothetical protein
MDVMQKTLEDKPMATNSVVRGPVDFVSVDGGAHSIEGTDNLFSDCHKHNTVETTMTVHNTCSRHRNKLQRRKQREKLLQVLSLSGIILQKVKELHQLAASLMDEDANELANSGG